MIIQLWNFCKKKKHDGWECHRQTGCHPWWSNLSLWLIVFICYQPGDYVKQNWHCGEHLTSQFCCSLDFVNSIHHNAVYINSSHNSRSRQLWNSFFIEGDDSFSTLEEYSLVSLTGYNMYHKLGCLDNSPWPLIIGDRSSSSVSCAFELNQDIILLGHL